MKKILGSLMVAAVMLALIGCDEDDRFTNSDGPAAPQGVFSITGDHAVYLYWNGPYESDIEEYVIYRSFDPIDNYNEIGRRDALSNSSLDLIQYEYVDNSAQNGQTYYYAVASVDNHGHISDLSAEEVFDTPRPEGAIRVLDTTGSYATSGYSFAAQSAVAWNSSVADIWFDQVGGIMFINKGRTDTDIQDMGWHETLDAVNVAPGDGWINGSFAEVVDGHVYVIWTADNNYAKIQIDAISFPQSYVDFHWAYQTDPGNPELSLPKEHAAQPMSSASTMTKEQYVAMRKGATK
jgi:hypothetical protein